MLPSRGFGRVSPGFQILSRAIVRQAKSRPSLASPRQFSTSFRKNALGIGFLSGRRTGAASILSSSSSSALLSKQRFASTDATATPSPPPPPPPPSSAQSTNASDVSSIEPGFTTFDDLDAASILNVPEGVGYLANLGIDYGWGPTSVCQWVMEHLHFDFGLGWWAAIVGVSLVTRVAMIYPSLMAHEASHHAQEMRRNPLYAEVNDKFMKAFRAGNTPPAQLMQLKHRVSLVKKQLGAKPMWHLMLPMLQIPFAYGTFKLTRAMAALPVPGLESGGTLWFTDLTVADPLYILPCVNSALMFFALKANAPSMSQEQAAFSRVMPYIFGPLTVLVTLSLPASVQLYFAAGGALHYLQTKLLNTPSARALAGLPPLVRADHAAQRDGMPNVRYQVPDVLKTTAMEHPIASNSSSSSSSSSSSNTAGRGWRSKLALFDQAKEKMFEFVAPVVEQNKDKQAKAKRLAYEKERRAQEIYDYNQRISRQRKRK